MTLAPLAAKFQVKIWRAFWTGVRSRGKYYRLKQSSRYNNNSYLTPLKSSGSAFSEDLLMLSALSIKFWLLAERSLLCPDL